MSETKGKRVRYDNTYLDSIIKKYDANVIEKYDKLTRDTRIKFICKCGKEGDKVFRNIVKNGGFKCKECTLIQSQGNAAATNLEKYGVINPFESEEIKSKIKQHYLDKYGCEYGVQCKEIHDKIKKVTFERYGVEFPFQSQNIIDKGKKTFLIKYGVDNPSKNKEILEKIKKVNLERFGVEHSIQDPVIFNKILCSNFKKKEYIFPSGNKCLVQGYEPLALDILINDMNISENDIITGSVNVPTIWYDYNNKKCRYYTDIYLSEFNTCIEVKSTWTFKKDYDKNRIKFLKTKELGYNVEFWIMSNKCCLNQITTIEEFDDYYNELMSCIKNK